MLNERAQIVLSVQPLIGEEDRRLVTDALLRLEGVRTAHVDVPRGVVRVDGAASDVELLATMEALGKRAAVVTHVSMRPPHLLLQRQRASLTLNSVLCWRVVHTDARREAAAALIERGREAAAFHEANRQTGQLLRLRKLRVDLRVMNVHRWQRGERNLRCA